MKITVYGQPISKHVLDAAIQCMRSRFRCADLIAAMRGALEPGEVLDVERAADRIIQHEARYRRIKQGPRVGDWSPAGMEPEKGQL